jgi:hypothetical protein
LPTKPSWDCFSRTVHATTTGVREEETNYDKLRFLVQAGAANGCWFIFFGGNGNL